MKPYMCYYVHAHGSGHIASFKLLYPELSEYFEVIAVTTNQKATNALQKLSSLLIIELPLKWAAGSEPPAHTFSKAFEETPYGPHAAERVAALLTIMQKYRPVAFISDGSPELAITARSMGVPIVLGHLPGNVMADPTQVFAYESADLIIAYFPAVLEAADYQYHRKTRYGGFMSKYAGRTMPASSDTSVTIILGMNNYPEKLVQTMTADATRSFIIIGNHQAYNLGDNCRQLGRVADIASEIRGDIVVSAAGQNTVAELLSLTKKLIVVPEARPYDEQLCNARALSRYGAAILGDESLSAEGWRALYDEADQYAYDYDELVNEHAPAELAQALKERYAAI